MGMPLAQTTESELLDSIVGAAERGQGGWLITANLDFLRRHHQEPAMRELYAQADVRVADGMPLVWACGLQGTPLPNRIAGASLVEPLAERSAAARLSLYLLGGDAGTAETSARYLQRRHPGLRIAGHESPRVSAPPDATTVQAISQRLKESGANVVLVALGSPKQELLIARLRADLPQTWFVGVGISFSFLTGKVARAPEWMQRTGLEWAHRLSQEPSRLARRYLVQGIPFGLALLASAGRVRLQASWRARRADRPDRPDR